MRKALWLPLQIFLLFLLVFALWCGAWYYTEHHIFSTNLTILTHEGARGVFGDQFGSVNALFSGLAFTGLIVSLLLQRREISAQARTLSRQQFEHGFFQMLGLLSNLIEKLDVNGHKSQEAFKVFYDYIGIRSNDLNSFNILKRLSAKSLNHLSANFSTDSDMERELGPEDAKELTKLMEDETAMRRRIALFMDTSSARHQEVIEEAFVEAHRASKGALSNYFRTLLHVLSYIDQSPLIQDEDRTQYAALLSAQMSTLEICVVFYYCLTPARVARGQTTRFGHPTMTALLKKYRLIDALDPSALYHPIHLDVFNGLS